MPVGAGSGGEAALVKILPGAGEPEEARLRWGRLPGAWMSARLFSVPLLAALSLAGCTGAPDSSDIAAKDPPGLPTGPVLGVANFDDDDGSGDADWDDVGADGEDDLAELAFTGLGPVTLSLAGATESVRIWQDGDVVLDASTTTATVEGTVWVEFADTLVSAVLTATTEDGRTADLALRSAPLILNHHRQYAERVMSLEGSGNEAFVDSFRAALGDAYFTGGMRNYDWDVWVQDELEFASMTAPGLRMDVVIDSIRSGGDQYLDAFPERELEAPGVAVRTWGRGRATSQDSFGNLEVSPPVTVDGVEYPFGRIYWGETGSWGLTEELEDMLVAQKVQAPFQLDIRWLCVGHVDEFSTFVPDPDAPKGFRLVYADTSLGQSLLAGLDPTTELPRYGQDHGYSTIGELVEDAALWEYNADLQVNYLDPNLEIFKRELGLDEADIVRIPAVFEESRMCSGGALSLIPGTANLAVADLGDGETHVFLADPFLREDDGDQAADPLIAEVARLLPASLTLHWVDDWETYHLAWGEVHCGSNVQRTPLGEWWTAAAHLLEAE